MNTFDYIKAKQKLWAEKRNIELIGSKNERGEQIYTRALSDNLFQDICESTIKEFSLGDGNELGNGIEPGKMQALHSSSVIGVNLFEYWKVNKDFDVLARSLYVPSKDIEFIQFEEKYGILRDARKSPNIDVNIHYKNTYLVGIECKFTEPFQNRTSNTGLKKKYIDEFEHWDIFPNLKELALTICPDDISNDYLHVAQLVKHVLGMYSVKKDKSKFRLLYIYQPAFFENNDKYSDEIVKIGDVLKRDNIVFQYLTWQELIISIKKNIGTKDENYMKYLEDRYL